MFQAALVLSGILMLASTILTINKAMMNHSTSLLNNEGRISGLAFAQQLLDEIASKSFDEKTTNGQDVSNTSSLTSTANLGYESGETTPDDVDDYHGLSFTFNSQRIPGFTANIVVYYVQSAYPKTTSSSQTYLKRVDINLNNSNYMTDSLTISSFIGYY